MHSHSKSAFSLGIKTESAEPEINLIPFIDLYHLHTLSRVSDHLTDSEWH